MSAKCHVLPNSLREDVPYMKVLNYTYIHHHQLITPHSHRHTQRDGFREREWFSFYRKTVTMLLSFSASYYLNREKNHFTR